MITVKNETEMQLLGERLGDKLIGDETIELIGDVGAGKTTLVRGIAKGMGITESVQSPSFTISRLYDARAEKRLAHYDFYRLQDPGIMKDELTEMVEDAQTSVIIEWGETVESALPDDRLVINIRTVDENTRTLQLEARGPISGRLLGAIV